MSNAEDMERAAGRAIDLCEERIAFLEERVLDRQAERDDLKRAARALIDALDSECPAGCEGRLTANAIEALEALL